MAVAWLMSVASDCSQAGTKVENKWSHTSTLYALIMCIGIILLLLSPKPKNVAVCNVIEMK